MNLCYNFSTNNRQTTCQNIIIKYYNFKIAPITIFSLKKQIRIFTKDGKEWRLKKGCPALNFAFMLKTEIGVCYNGTNMKNKLAKMGYIPKPGDKITIIKADTPNPHLDQFNFSKLNLLHRDW